MKMSNSTILSVALITVLISSMAFAVSPVRDPVLYFNPVETHQQKANNVWRNAGTAGGQLKRGAVKPNLEHGTIEIPAIGMSSRTMPLGTQQLSLRLFLPTTRRIKMHLLSTFKILPLDFLCE